MKYTKITIKINTKDKPPYFMGSQLRGAFGYALKKVTCLNPPTKKGVCFAGSSCLYCNFFEEKNTFHKYRFDIVLNQDSYEFNFYLFDNATSHVSYVLSAFYIMLTQNGLGKEKKIYPDFEMLVNDENSIKDGQINLPQKFTNTFHIDKVYKNIRLDFITALRIKKNNRFIRNAEDLELNDIINSIYKRQMGLLGRDYKNFPYEIKGKIVKNELKYRELTRLSNRQKTIMNFGGLIGSVYLENLSKECYEVLKLGELIAVGKQTVFGLGKIKILKEEM